jgi:hypothetical protein
VLTVPLGRCRDEHLLLGQYNIFLSLANEYGETLNIYIASNHNIQPAPLRTPSPRPACNIFLSLANEHRKTELKNTLLNIFIASNHSIQMVKQYDAALLKWYM